MKFLLFIILCILTIQVSYSFNGCDGDCQEEASFSDYKVEDCALTTDLQSNFEEKHCRHGAISFEQPMANGSSIEFNGRTYNTEGKCGQTAFSNLLKMTCGYSVTPKQVDETYMNIYTEEIEWYEYLLGIYLLSAKRKLTDLFPGSLPSTIENGLNKFFDQHPDCGSKRWQTKDAQNAREYIDNIENGLLAGGVSLSTKIKRRDDEIIYRSPVAVLIKYPNTDSLHWITITDLQRDHENGCVVTFSSYGDEFKTSCDQLSQWSFNIQKNYSSVLSSLTYVTVQLDN